MLSYTLMHSSLANSLTHSLSPSPLLDQWPKYSITHPIINSGGDSIGDIENTNNANNGIISSCSDEKIVNNKENQVPNLVDQARKSLTRLLYQSFIHPLTRSHR